MGKKKIELIIGSILLSCLIIVIFLYVLAPRIFSSTIKIDSGLATTTRDQYIDSLLGGVINFVSGTTTDNVVKHVETPSSVKALYMTSWVAGTPSLRSKIVDIIDKTEINSLVIDIKDDTGRVSFAVNDPFLQNIGSSEVRISDLREFIADLHSKNIYVIGRLSSFQDPYMVKVYPERAVKRESDGGVWKDRKGLSWIDPSNKDHWNYLISIAKESYGAGFDEINFDYIRFPSDGNMKDIMYPYSKELSKREVLRSFYSYVREELGDTGMKISADLFGMVTTNTDDLGIGQVLEDALIYFDYVAPMIYPSHYPENFNGWNNPNAVPYDLISFVLGTAVSRASATSTTLLLPGELPIASTTPQQYTKKSIDINKIRPWLQDFSLGKPTYGAKEVRDQIQATYDAGLNSWMLWDAANTYTVDALLEK